MTPIRILHLEDSVRDSRMIQDLLELGGRMHGFTIACDRHQFEDALEQTAFDLIICDFNLPDFDGLGALKLAKKKHAKTPVIIVSAAMDAEEAVACLKAGATDYVLKQRLERLPSAVARALEEARGTQQRCEAREKIREQAELIDLAPDAIIVCDLGRRITHWNPAAERLYGWSAAEALGQRADVLLIRGGDAEASAQEPLSKDEWRGELTQITRDEKEIVVDSRCKLLRDPDGRPKAILTVNTDLTEKKQFEAQFLRAQRLESIGTLASGIAHDLNNALSPSLMSIDLLRDRLTEQDDLALVDMLEANTHRGAQLVRQILGFARGYEGERADVQLLHLVTEMRRLLTQTFPRNIEIKIERRGNIWPVIGNANQLDQVLMNLCVNARDAMPEGGRLAISLENISLTDADCAALPAMSPGPCVLLTVADTGTGIPAEILEKIFDPFFTTKELGNGTGLGLSTVFSVVKGHAGWVTAESEPGTGTRFKVWLPATVEPAHHVCAATAPKQLPCSGGERVLVVDDEDSILTVVGAILTRLGYQPLYASDGIGALKVFNEHMGSIRLVLTDGMMPNLNGTLLARAIHRLSPGLPIILMTGFLDHAPPDDGSITEQLQKPFTSGALVGAIRRALDSSRVIEAIAS